MQLYLIKNFIAIAAASFLIIGNCQSQTSLSSSSQASLISLMENFFESKGKVREDGSLTWSAPEDRWSAYFNTVKKWCNQQGGVLSGRLNIIATCTAKTGENIVGFGTYSIFFEPYLQARLDKKAAAHQRFLDCYEKGGTGADVVMTDGRHYNVVRFGSAKEPICYQFGVGKYISDVESTIRIDTLNDKSTLETRLWTTQYKDGTKVIAGKGLSNFYETATAGIGNQTQQMLAVVQDEPSKLRQVRLGINEIASLTTNSPLIQSAKTINLSVSSKQRQSIQAAALTRWKEMAKTFPSEIFATTRIELENKIKYQRKSNLLCFSDTIEAEEYCGQLKRETGLLAEENSFPVMLTYEKTPLMLSGETYSTNAKRTLD